MLLQNDRIYLRALEPEDLELLYEIENDRKLWWTGTTTAPYSRYALKQYIATQPQDIYQCGELRLVVCTPKHEAVGLLDLFDFDPYNQRAEVGIALLTAARGKGFGQAALAAIEDFARTTLRLHQIYAYISREQNKPSRRLFIRSGYTECATLPQWHQYEGTFEDVSVFCKFLSK